MKHKKYAAFGMISLNAIQVTAQPVSDESNRLYGTPDSVQTKHEQTLQNMRLSLKSDMLPDDVMRDVEEVTLFWQRMVTAGGDVDKYAAMYSHSGFSSELKQRIQQSYEHRFLMALADPKLTMYARKGDYESLVHELQLRGVFESDAHSNLVHRLSEIIRTDPKIRQRMEQAIADIPNLHKLTGLQPDADLQEIPNNLVELLNNTHLGDARPESLFFAVVAVAFAALAVATYVTVEINVIAQLNLAVHISVYGEIAVCGWTADCGPPKPEPPPGGDECVGCQDCTDQCKIVGGLSAPKPVIMLSRSMEKNHCVMSAFSVKAKSSALQRRNRIELEKQQAIALFSALRNNGIVKLAEPDAAAVSETLALLIERKYNQGKTNDNLSP
jgi:hypothetical protein